MAVGGPLFGPSTARSQSKALVEFRCGKMTFNERTKMVSPDKRKGMLMVTQSDDQLMHLQWKERSSGSLEDDLILMPDDVEFKAVPACTTGRVFVLKFKGNDKKMFFWMQEPKTDKDEEFCKKVNDFLNNPPAPGSSRSGGGGSGGVLGGLPGGLPGNLDFNNLGDNELQSLLNNMDQRQLMQLFGGSLGGSGGGGSNISSLSSLLGGGASSGRTRQAAGSGPSRSRETTQTSSTSTTTTTTTTSSSTTSSSTPATVPVPAPAPGGAGPAIQLSDLQSILSNMQVPGAGAGGGAVDLSTALTGETLQPLLQNQEFLDKVKEFLPAGEEGKETSLADLSGTVQSPQFQQALSMFCMALSSGQLGPLIREFGLGEEAGGAADKMTMISLNDRLMLECPEDYNEMADQLDADDCEEVEEANPEPSQSTQPNGNGLDRSELVIIEDKSQATYEAEEDLEDLEESLQALERLDRSSPDLWPDHIPGVGQFLPQTPFMDTDTPRGSQTGGYLHNLSREELETLMQLGGLSVPQLVCEVKRLQNVAYQLGQEESKEMTRGKYLNILKKKNSSS